MKKIVVTTRKEDAKEIEKIFGKRLHVVEKKGGLVIVTAYIPDEELEEIIAKLDKCIDFRFKDSLIEVSSPYFVKSSVLERIEKKEKVVESAPVEKLLDSVRIYTKFDIGKLGLTSIAGIIAMIGLFMNNVAVVIGAMLLSPLLGPIYAFAINTAVGDVKDAFKSIGNLALMILVVIFLSFTFSCILSRFISLPETPEIVSRMIVDPIYVVIAVLLGFASILALSKGVSESIAGVAVAAAILPPAVVSGIALVGYTDRFVGPLVITLDNLAGLMAGSLLATLILNIGPRKYYEKTVAKRFIKRTSILIVILLLILLMVSIYL